MSHVSPANSYLTLDFVSALTTSSSYVFIPLVLDYADIQYMITEMAKKHDRKTKQYSIGCLSCDSKALHSAF